MGVGVDLSNWQTEKQTNLCVCVCMCVCVCVRVCVFVGCISTVFLLRILEFQLPVTTHDGAEVTVDVALWDCGGSDQ